MSRLNLVSGLMIFLLGICMGTFLTVTVIREAVSLKQQMPTVMVYALCITPAFLILFAWYLHIVKLIKQSFGAKGGKAINSILLFLLVTLVVVFVLISGLLFFSVA